MSFNKRLRHVREDATSTTTTRLRRRSDADNRRLGAKEMVGDNVTIEVREVLEHYGDTVVSGAIMTVTFRPDNLPDEHV